MGKSLVDIVDRTCAFEIYLFLRGIGRTRRDAYNNAITQMESWPRFTKNEARKGG